MTTRRPAPITDWDWYDCTCGFTCPHCGQPGLIISEPGVFEPCSCCGMRYWLEVRVMEEPPAIEPVMLGEDEG